MKFITTGLLLGVLLGGLLLSPFAMGIQSFTSVFAQEEDEDAEDVKQVTLIANETVLQVAPDNPLHPGGIMYSAMTFNNTIPGPVIAVNQGDIINITTFNAGKVIHSLDFHAGLGPSKVLSGNIAPGESKSVVLHADNAGAYLYHCGADALNGVWEHIANGMYGAVVVHPEDEEPAKEFYVSFSEIYNSADKGPFVGTNGTVGTFDIGKFWNNSPDLVLTNGMAHKYVPGVGETSKIPLNANATVFKVKPGELTRWYILNPGPNDYVAFHFISGQITVRDGNIDGNFGTQMVNDETWTIPPGSASVIESTFPEAGTYIGLDHAMSDALKGGAFAVVADENSTATDHPEGTAVAPKDSESPVWRAPEVSSATLSDNMTMTDGNMTNATSQTWNATMSDNMTMTDGNMTNATTSEVMNATMSDNMTNATTSDAGNMSSMVMNQTMENGSAVSIPSGSSNPSATEFYTPANLTVAVGTTVTWTNDDATIHTVTQGSPESQETAPLFDSSILAAGKTFEYKFDQAGTFDYYCTLHPFMVGTVTVQ